MISETKPDDKFPVGHFFINGYSSPYRLDRDSQGGKILFVRKDPQSKLLPIEPYSLESFE